MGLAAKFYSDELSLKGYGTPLWMPESSPEVQIGDVGYILANGSWLRLFNVLYSEDSDINEDGVPDGFRPLRFKLKLFKRWDRFLNPGVLYSSSVKQISAKFNASTGAVPMDMACRYECSSGAGALLALQDPAVSEEVVHNQNFVEYMRRNHASWCEFARRQGFIVDREDIILVRGWVKASSWTAAAFMEKGHALELNLGVNATLSASFGVSVVGSVRTTQSVECRSGHVESNEHTTRSRRIASTYRTVLVQERTPTHCVFLSCYKIKYRSILPTKIVAAAEPSEDSKRPENSPNSDSTATMTAPDTASSVEIEVWPKEEKAQTHVDKLLDYLLAVTSADVAIASDIHIVNPMSYNCDLPFERDREDFDPDFDPDIRGLHPSSSIRANLYELKAHKQSYYRPPGFRRSKPKPSTDRSSSECMTSLGGTSGIAGTSTSESTGGVVRTAAVKRENKYACRVTGCTNTSLTRVSFMEHLRSHTEGNPNQCGWPECGKIFANEDHRELHESFHFIRTRLNYCEGCKRNFRKKDALNRHLRSEGGAKCRTILEKTASSSGTEGANDGSAAAGASGTSNGQTGDTTLDATTKPDPNKHWTAMKGEIVVSSADSS